MAGKKNILFMAGMYYPRSSANGVCSKNVVDELIRQGYNVTCIVNSDSTRKNEEYIDGAHIYRVKPRLSYRLQEWCHYNSHSKLRKVVETFAWIVNKIQLLIMSPFWPYISPLCTLRFYKKAKRLCRETEFSFLISVYTPMDTLYAGYLIKKKYPSISFVPYYLDALAGGWGPKMWSKKKIDRRTRLVETKINEVSNLVISMKSSEIYHQFAPLTDENSFRRIFLDVPTFIIEKREIVENIKMSHCDSINVLFIGSIRFPHRDPRPLLKHFAILCQNNNIELNFIGTHNCPEIFSEYEKKSDGKIKHLGQFSHDDAMEKLKRADFLVNIGSTNPNTITCKIFEYMQFHKPIISTFTIENEPSIPYLKKYGCYFLLDERPNKNFDVINNQLLSYILSKPKVEDKNYSKIFYLNTPTAFVDTIKIL